MYIQKRKIYADEEILDEVVVDVAPEATELLFEAEDVAELVAEVTGEPVDVTSEEDSVVFAVGGDEFTVEAEGSEEVLESVRRPMKGKRKVSASTNRRRAKGTSKTIRKVPRK